MFGGAGRILEERMALWRPVSVSEVGVLLGSSGVSSERRSSTIPNTYSRERTSAVSRYVLFTVTDRVNPNDPSVHVCRR